MYLIYKDDPGAQRDHTGHNQYDPSNADDRPFLLFGMQVSNSVFFLKSGSSG